MRYQPKPNYIELIKAPEDKKLTVNLVTPAQREDGFTDHHRSFLPAFTISQHEMTFCGHPGIKLNGDPTGLIKLINLEGSSVRFRSLGGQFSHPVFSVEFGSDHIAFDSQMARFLNRLFAEHMKTNPNLQPALEPTAPALF